MTKYLSPSRYWRRLFILVNKIVLNYIDMLMAPVYDRDLKYPPVFIIGAPRSGSTLVYQVLTDAFDVGYLSNLHCKFFGAPALAERLFRPLKDKSCSDYTSRFGATLGRSGPSECGLWWYRFFPSKPVYVSSENVDDARMRRFRRSIISLTETFDKPVIFKNLYASMRLEPISMHIPEALFVIIKRNEFDNALSILDGRKTALGRYDQWWSVPPPNIEQLKLLEPASQAVEQIRAIHNVIYEAEKNGFIDRRRVLTFKYEDFCSDVRSSLDNFERFLISHDVHLARRFSVPDRFPNKRSVRIDEDIYSSLKNIFHNSRE